jgi:hypothetical protein
MTSWPQQAAVRLMLLFVVVLGTGRQHQLLMQERPAAPAAIGARQDAAAVV